MSAEIKLCQDSELLGDERFIRRMFEPPQREQQQQRQQHQTTSNSQQQEPTTTTTTTSNDPASRPRFAFEKVYQRSFLGVNQSFVIATRQPTKEDDREQEIAIRIRGETSGRSEWLNELQVYHIPNFRHANILDYLGSEQSQSSMIREELPRISDIRISKYLLDSYEELLAQEARQKEAASQSGNNNTSAYYSSKLSPGGGVRFRLQYWLLNRFDNCIVLRDYLREQALDWAQMIQIARGIVDGLHYLHENGDYQDIDKDQAIRGFIRSTNGALKRVVFVDKNNSKILMYPEHTCSIIHRNLTSMNVVLRGGAQLTPCIWNFGHSKIHHPFQPTNHVNLIDKRHKDVFMSSPYSSPEVLQERAYMTLKAMKSIDMYACGILFWELLSRCRLPYLVGGFEDENRERADPDPYAEPFEREFGPNPSAAMLQYAVSRLHARPKLRDSWLVGKNSYQFTRTIQDLWDQDFDARVHTSTVMDRLDRLDLSSEELRYDFTPRQSKSFDVETQWPPKVCESVQVPPFLDKCEPNFIFLDD